MESNSDFTLHNDLACRSTGGSILFATADHLGVAENLIRDEAAEWIEGTSSKMDGWVTSHGSDKPRQHWCIIQLGLPGIIHGFDIDTSHFIGNHTTSVSIQVACIKQGKYRARSPGIVGTANQQILQQWSTSEGWLELVPEMEIAPGFPLSCHNLLPIDSLHTWTHVRLNISQGGLARLRVYGEVAPPWDNTKKPELVDLISVTHGGYCYRVSRRGVGHPQNLIKKCSPRRVGDGWAACNYNSSQKEDKKEWAEYMLGQVGIITKVVVDTRMCMRDCAGSCIIEGTVQEKGSPNETWQTVVPEHLLSPNRQHEFSGSSLCRIGAVRRIRLTLLPDGGISRLRIYGYRLSPNASRL